MDFYTEKDGDVTLFILSGGSREAIDRWLQAVQEHLATLNEPMRLLMDFSSDKVGFSPYLRKAGLEALHLLMEHEGKIALILATPWGRQLVRLLLATYRRLPFEYRIFTRQEEALRWLRE